MGKVVVNGLVEKRAEIAGEIEEAEQRILTLKLSLSHLDATIRLLAPEIRLASIKSKRPYRKNTTFGPGELSRLVRETLRDADRPLSTGDITRQIL